MADIQSTESNYVRYILFSEIVNPLIIPEPVGWREDEMELTRHKDYHGIFFTFTGGLKFYGDAKLYILDVYNVLGINGRLLLVKQSLREVDGVVKFTDDYSAFADFSTMVITETDLTINFNSYDLADTLKSHEDDEFELERITDIEGNVIDRLVTETTTFAGRSLSTTNEHVLYKGRGTDDGFFTPYDDQDSSWYIFGNARYESTDGITPLTKLVSESGDSRNASVDDFKCHDYQDMTAANTFFTAVDNTQQDLTSKVTLSFSITWYVEGSDRTVIVDLFKYKWNQSTQEYSKVEELYSETWNPKPKTYCTDASKDDYKVTCAWDEALALRLHIPAGGGGETNFVIQSLSINVREDSFYEPTPNGQFLFTHDVGERLAYIISGQKGSFYSKFFGRVGTYQDYPEDGEAAFIGNTTGLWVRDFKPGSDKYKSLTINFKTWYESAKAVFNIGLGIDNVSNKERIRIEDLRYFYQNEVVIRLHNQVANVKRSVDPTLFFSGTTMGYKDGGDYSGEMGLDEPNTQSNWITPIRKSELKYEQISNIRADDYGMEITRRKPQKFYPDEDTQRDEAIWWLDMVDNSDGTYQQATWPDRLVEAPTKIHDPDSFYGMIFTPQQMLFRHGWVLRAGLEKYTNKYILYGSSKANNKLTMQFIGKDKYRANQDIGVSDLDRSRVLPEIVEFEHEVDDELLNKLLGYTQAMYQGSVEPIRNYYFKIEWLNEFGEWEKGYLKSLKPKGKGIWVMQKSNEEVLGEQALPIVVIEFKVNLTVGQCNVGETDYPDSLYFTAPFGTQYPSIGNVIYKDSVLSETWNNGGTKMSNQEGLVTDENGIVTSFECP